MANNTERFTAVIDVNSQQAKAHLEELKRERDALRAQQKKYYEEGTRESRKRAQALTKDIDSLTRKINAETKYVQGLDTALQDLSQKTYKDLQREVSTLKRMMRDGTAAKESDVWKAMAGRIRQCQEEMRTYDAAIERHQSAWSRLLGYLNKNWGAFTQMLGVITGLSMTIRKSAQSYADMEEAMADTRKYTGLTDEVVRELNEDLKKMDTRTARDKLNELAGSAGRLGKTAKKDILDFVDAGNMIQVALGDDLGEGAIDKVGKLAMAFGEDERMGLRGAMLATGSAVNELAQNSSAQAGYLVDFTARVAGFGKQLGLTQAQIMGFGAVMDENLLRDEMAATAFGNMLTKMQTDTEKFARIAGKSVTEFTDLLKNDANAAILAVADSLKRQNPQIMMKMLDDMGLDGNRAVGVLSTLADKIDDVRARQQLATEAYREGTSVENEYAVMNNTVQARIDKCKKQFQEMSIELGERLMPVVKYTISSFSMMVKLLSMLANFVTNNWKAIAILSAEMTLLTAVYKAAEIRAYAWYLKEMLLNNIQKAGTALLKLRTAAALAYNAGVALLTGNITRATAAMRLMRMAALANPYTALLAVVLTLGTAIYGLVAHFRSASKEAQENAKAIRQLKAEHDALKAVSKEANQAVAEEMTRFRLLRKTLEDTRKGYKERKAALDEIKRMVPEYHGQLTAENKLINNNADALDGYTVNLLKAARAQAAYNKMVKLQESSMGHEDTLKQRQGNRLYAEQQLKNLGASENTTFKYADWNMGYAMYDKQGKFVKYVDAELHKQIVHYQELIGYNDRRISQEREILATNQQQSEQMQKIVDEGKDASSKKTTPSTIPYRSTADEKKEERERRKREAAEKKEQTERERRQREAAKQRKAQTEAELADLTLSYSQGNIDYRTFLKERQRIQLEGIRQRKAIFEQGSAEYKKLEAQEKALLINGDEERKRMTLEQLQREHQQKMAMLEAQYYNERSKAYHNEHAINESLHEEDVEFLKKKAALYRRGSKERMQTEWEIEDKELKHMLDNRMRYEELRERMREEYFAKSSKRRQAEEEMALKNMYDELKKQGLMEEKEYQQLLTAIRVKYARERADKEIEISKEAQDALNRAELKAGQRKESKGGQDNIAVGLFNLTTAVTQQAKVNRELKKLYDDGIIDQATYTEAMEANAKQSWENIREAAATALNSIAGILGGVSAYAQACSDLEVAKITKNYDKQIEAAGNNSKKREKLEKKRDAEIAAAKTKANKKAVTIQIAQAIATTAANAISAYGAVLVPGSPWTVPLAIAAAAAATASGMLQVATIKKQAEAQKAGYYKGGFTGGTRYRKEAGVVHEGEFVANHQAVNNRQLMPVFSLLDQAQRNNRVASLRAEDVTNVMGGPAAQVVAPIVNVRTDNSELHDTLEMVRETQDRLATQLEQGIGVDVPIDGENGIYRRMKRYENLLKNK